MPQGYPALTFADNGGRHPMVPHSPPGSYRSPCRLFSKHVTARIGVSLKDTTVWTLTTFKGEGVRFGSP
jgi:hypothetical protein